LSTRSCRFSCHTASRALGGTICRVASVHSGSHHCNMDSDVAVLSARSPLFDDVGRSWPQNLARPSRMQLSPCMYRGKVIISTCLSHQKERESGRRGIPKSLLVNKELLLALKLNKETRRTGTILYRVIYFRNLIAPKLNSILKSKPIISIVVKLSKKR
jgi:hypothetical protein